MKKISVLLIFLLFSCAEEKNRFVNLKGDTVYLKKNQGKKTLLIFWATYCNSCIEEMNYIQKVKTTLERENYNVLFASNETIKKIKNFKKQNDFDFTFIKYNGNLSNLKIHTLPTTFVYNEENEQINKITGVLNLKSLNIKPYENN